MAQITKADVLLVAAELSTLSDDQFAALIDDAYTEIKVANWPSEAKANRAAKYLVAHLATMNARLSGAGGPVQSYTAGGVSIMFATSSSAGSAVGSTGYGQEYRRLVRLSFGGPLVL